MSKRIKVEAAGVSSEKTLKRSIGDTEIGRFASELASLMDDHFALDEGKIPDDKPVSEELWDRAEALQDYIAYLEPESFEDVTTLTYILGDCINRYIGNCSDRRLQSSGDPEIDAVVRQDRDGREPTDREVRDCRVLERRIDMLPKKIQRSLGLLAPSPLTEERLPCYMRGSFADARRKALDRARRAQTVAAMETRRAIEGEKKANEAA
jgi:hypothetical protein